MSETQISDPAISVNDEAVSILPNSVTFNEGFGEQSVKNTSAGNGIITQVYEDNVETQVGMIKFSLKTTVSSTQLARSWKANRNENRVVFTAITPEGTLKRTFTGMALVNNYDVNPQTDGSIELIFEGNRPTP